MADKQRYDVLDNEGALLLAKGILDKVNVRISQRIVQNLSADDEKHVPSAAAVLKAIKNAQHVSIQTITGDINVEVPLEKRSTSVLYFQRDNEEDKTWSIYIWNADPTLDPDPDGYWICIGTTEVDLSNYWSKSDEDVKELGTRLGVDTLKTEVEKIKTSDEGLKTDVENIKTDITNINAEMDNKVSHDEISIITEAVIAVIMQYAESETDPFPAEATSAAEITAALDAAVAEGKTDLRIDVKNDIDFSADDAVVKIPAGITATIKIPEGTTLTCKTTAIDALAGSNLALSGKGTIKMIGTKVTAAVKAEAGATLTINGITIDATTQGTTNNYSYGVYAIDNSVINMVSGVIKVGQGCAISTNNTTGGAKINIYGGELYSDGCYAIYNAAQSEINISGGIVQGISARMGDIKISGDAKIIGTTITESTCDNIGSNIATTGCIWLGDTIALITGTYSGEDSAKTALSITGNATVESSFRAGIGVYMLDTKLATVATVTVDKANAVTTKDAGYDAIKVYDHDYITEAATAAGKTFTPAATCDLTVRVAGSKIYPAA